MPKRRRIQAGRAVAIRVNGFQIRDNKRDGTEMPCIMVHTRKLDIACSHVEFTGPARVVQSFDAPLNRGPLPANVWIETDHDIYITEPAS